MEPIFYKIDTEIPPSYTEKLLHFIYKKYLSPQKERFSGISRKKIGADNFLSYTVLDALSKQQLQVELKGAKPLELKITPISEQVADTVIEEAKQDVVIALQIFEENARKTTLYFAWREGEEIVPEAVDRGEKSLQRLFLETQVLLSIVFGVLFVVVITATIAFFPDSIWIAPLILIAVQFIFVFYSTWFIARTADWKITKANPTIHFLEYHLPLKENGDFSKAYSQEQLQKIKKEVFDEILAKRGEIDCEAANKVFEKHGVACQPENLTSKKVNVYELVKKVADKFGYPTPKIVVSNTMLPNAAAAGPSPSRGLVLITTGLLVQLDDDEVTSVLGHEFGHLKGRDPLLLFGLTSAEFLVRFYVLFVLFQFTIPIFLLLIYYLVVFSVIFFIAKFFEARSDLVSAIKIGQPEVLADALEKIGFQRLLYERAPSFRIQEWIGLDAHPPLYFRINRLEKLKAPVKIKYPLLRSIKDVISGFFESI